MNEFASKIEALELRWMRAWVNGDKAEMKTLATRDFISLFAGATPTILDRASWLDVAPRRLCCESFRIGDGYVRRHGAFAVFAAPIELKAAPIPALRSASCRKISEMAASVVDPPRRDSTASAT